MSQLWVPFRLHVLVRRPAVDREANQEAGSLKHTSTDQITRTDYHSNKGTHIRIAERPQSLKVLLAGRVPQAQRVLSARLVVQLVRVVVEHGRNVLAGKLVRHERHQQARLADHAVADGGDLVARVRGCCVVAAAVAVRAAPIADRRVGRRHFAACVCVRVRVSKKRACREQ